MVVRRIATAAARQLRGGRTVKFPAPPGFSERAPSPTSWTDLTGQEQRRIAGNVSEVLERGEKFFPGGRGTFDRADRVLFNQMDRNNRLLNVAQTDEGVTVTRQAGRLSEDARYQTQRWAGEVETFPAATQPTPAAPTRVGRQAAALNAGRLPQGIGEPVRRAAQDWVTGGMHLLRAPITESTSPGIRGLSELLDAAPGNAPPLWRFVNASPGGPSPHASQLRGGGDVIDFLSLKPGQVIENMPPSSFTSDFFSTTLNDFTNRNVMLRVAPNAKALHVNPITEGGRYAAGAQNEWIAKGRFKVTSVSDRELPSGRKQRIIDLEHEALEEMRRPPPSAARRRPPTPDQTMHTGFGPMQHSTARYGAPGRSSGSRANS